MMCPKHTKTFNQPDAMYKLASKCQEDSCLLPEILPLLLLIETPKSCHGKRVFDVKKCPPSYKELRPVGRNPLWGDTRLTNGPLWSFDLRPYPFIYCPPVGYLLWHKLLLLTIIPFRSSHNHPVVAFTSRQSSGVRSHSRGHTREIISIPLIYIVILTSGRRR